MKGLIILMLLFPASLSSQELEMIPFATDDYKSIRPLAVEKYEVGFRLFASNAKSLDRVITLTKYRIPPLYKSDTLNNEFQFYGEVKFIGTLNQKEFIQTKEFDQQRVKELINALTDIGFENFETDNSIISGIHDPNSTYTIVWINKGNKTEFSFHTEYPRKRTRQREFENLEDIFFELFPELKEIK